MGVQISDIIPRKEITLEELKGKIIAIDAFNAIYQFLTTIRQADGTPLMDSQGKVTSHLSGLFYRNLNLLIEGIKPVYVFDGKPPKLKADEIERRLIQKEIASDKYEKARLEGNEEDMRKYSQQTVRINDTIIKESKELLEAMGIPIVQASGEGEAEASFLTKNNKAWATSSQDYDALLYGAPRLIRNLTLARKRKTPTGYTDVTLELIDFDYLLNNLQIDKDQLICLGILVGTDYNPGGVKGIGQKRALDIVKQYKYPINIFEYIQNSDKYEINFDWQEIFREFHEYQCCENPEINFMPPNEERIREILTRSEFSLERINSGLERIRQSREKQKQKTLF